MSTDPRTSAADPPSADPTAELPPPDGASTGDRAAPTEPVIASGAPELPRARRRLASPGRVASVFSLVVTLVVVLDQLAKEYAVRVLGAAPLDLGWVRLVDVRNPNAAFNIPGFPGLFILVTAVVVVLVVRALPRTDRTSLGLGYGLVTGGALGNCIDRIVRPPGFPSGAVVDIIDLGWFPVFNLADSAITVGAVLVAITLTLVDRDEREAERERAAHSSVRPDVQPPSAVTPDSP